jgi:hypothetical protein
VLKYSENGLEAGNPPGHKGTGGNNKPNLTLVDPAGGGNPRGYRPSRGEGPVC